jgi:hypothetical protein
MKYRIVYCLDCEKVIAKGHTFPLAEAKRIAREHNANNRHVVSVLEQTYRKGTL